MSSSSKIRGKGKGKARVSPTETDPLLPSLPSDDDAPIEHPIRRVPQIRNILATTLIVTTSLTLAALLFLVLLAYSFRPSERELDLLPKTAFAYAGPDDVHVLNVTDDGILVKISLRCGIDIDSALGIRPLDNRHKDEAITSGMRGTGAHWWESLRRWTAYRVLDQLPTQAVEIYVPDPIMIFPQQLEKMPLLSMRIMESLTIPFVTGVNTQSPWLQPLTFTALAKPIASTGQLWDFVQQSWAMGEARVAVSLHRAEAKLPEGVWWAKYVRGEKEGLVLRAELPVPVLPRLPRPGQPLNLSQLVHLDGYSFFTATSNTLGISANASIPNPTGNVSAVVPFSVPFSIALADGTRMAEVLTSPIYVKPQPRIDLTMSGRVLANLSEGASRDSPLSKFLQNYLHGLDNPITVQGLSRLPHYARVDQLPPSWLLDSLPSLVLPLMFPGPKPPPRIIQSVTIEHMRLAERAGKMRASGVVIAEIELPRGMQSVTVNVVEVLPDVLVYDGPAGDDEADPEDPPPRAFGHILPEEFLDSTTEPSSDPEHPHRMTVRAPLQDVPLDVLPGRDSVLSDFVKKVVFKGGAQAGVKGTASVRVEIPGVIGRVRLDNLPVKGEFWVGRQRG